MSIFLRANQAIEELKSTSNSPVGVVAGPWNLSTWVPPLGIGLKINCDVTVKKNSTHGAIVVLLRNSHGNLIDGIAKFVTISSILQGEAFAIFVDYKLQPGTSLEAELWAVYKGLIVVLQQGLNGVIIETDAAQVVQLLQEEVGDKCLFRHLVEDSKILLKGCNCTVQHVWKEANLCADALAKLRAAQPEDMLVVKEPPVEIRSLLVDDML
ncbi:uncharacterized protein LOC114279985 [Camellia sinensis]|uniref:uncharacterized protein LOC114279985 n=1 Tax=Camellia sinensis TaxID=4442 RepID=UPI00103698A3|nr:uncharacterized protein LOC114279985 [Camellia sinensis]